MYPHVEEIVDFIAMCHQQIQVFTCNSEMIKVRGMFHYGN